MPTGPDVFRIDPYLMYGYEHKHLRLQCSATCTIRIEIDPSGTGDWHTYTAIECKNSAVYEHAFPTGFNAHWVRLVSDRRVNATALFFYNAEGQAPEFTDGPVD